MNSENLNNFDRDGVILLKEVIQAEAITAVKNEYEKLSKTLTRREILKDEPLIVFWRHVVGEKKRLCTFGEFPTLLNLIKKNIVTLVRKNFGERIKKMQLLEFLINHFK